VLCLTLVAGFVCAAPAGAITFGQLDGNRHPYVGALFADWDPDTPGTDLLCSGTLISPTVFLTASHCTAFLESEGIAPGDVSVSFDPEPTDADGVPLPSATLLSGTYHTHPQFGTGGNSDPHDIAVVVLDSLYTATAPAQLPTANYLNTIALKSQRFTAVGYGTVRETKTKGPNAFFFDGKRRFVDQGFNALTPYWLKLTTNPSTGSGGTCYGDSGGPHFLGDSRLLVSITITGDTACRATDATYRTDTASARAFLGQYVALP
jgi:hypothetical protein